MSIYKPLWWNAHNAKKWLLRTGMDHIKDGLYAEGGMLVEDALWGSDHVTRKGFRKLMKDVCWWDNDMIDDAIWEIKTIK